MGGGCKSHHSEHVYQAQQVCVVGGGARATILSMYTRCVCGEGGGGLLGSTSSACTPGSTGVILSMYTRLSRCHPQHVHQVCVWRGGVLGSTSSACTPGSTGVILSMYTRLMRVGVVCVESFVANRSFYNPTTGNMLFVYC